MNEEPVLEGGTRAALNVFLVLLGLVVGAIAGVVIAFMAGWLGPFVC
jgi:hypothetical protein